MDCWVVMCNSIDSVIIILQNPLSIIWYDNPLSIIISYDNSLWLSWAGALNSSTPVISTIILFLETALIMKPVLLIKFEVNCVLSN